MVLSLSLSLKPNEHDRKESNRDDFSDAATMSSGLRSRDARKEKRERGWCAIPVKTFAE